MPEVNDEVVKDEISQEQTVPESPKAIDARKLSPRESVPAEMRTRTVVVQSPMLPPEDARRVQLLHKALDEMVAKAQDKKLPMRRMTKVTATFSDDEDGRFSVLVAVDQYGSTSQHVTHEEPEEG